MQPVISSLLDTDLYKFTMWQRPAFHALRLRRFEQAPALQEGRKRLLAKIAGLREFEKQPKRRHPFEFFDFGVRRRFSGDWQREVVASFKLDPFLGDFDLYFPKLFDGLRHDSGDPVVWGEKALAHYEKWRIDPHIKRLVFSDGLDFDKSIALYKHFADRTQTGFGIGTNPTNDMGLRTLRIVMKLTHAKRQPVAKLSDSPAKLLCDDAAPSSGNRMASLAPASTESGVTRVNALRSADGSRVVCNSFKVKAASAATARLAHRPHR